MALPVDWQEGKTVGECVSHMRQSHILTDVTFIFPARGDQPKDRIEAHKLMLVGRSTVFETMFCGNVEAPGNSIKITDIEPNTFRDMLQYVYTDNVDLTPENVRRLAKAAQKYMMVALVDDCIDFIAERISGDNIIDTLEFAVYYNFKDLQMACLHYMKDNIETNYDNLWERYVKKQTLEYLLNVKDQILREDELFEYCHWWAGEKCKKNSLEDTPENRRLMLGPLLYKLRLGSLPYAEFIVSLDAHQILSNDEELSLYRSTAGVIVENPAFPVKPRMTIWAGYTSHNQAWAEVTVRSQKKWKLLGFLTNNTRVPYQSLSINGFKTVRIVQDDRYRNKYTFRRSIFTVDPACRTLELTGGVATWFSMKFFGKGDAIKVKRRQIADRRHHGRLQRQAFWLEIDGYLDVAGDVPRRANMPPKAKDRVLLSHLMVLESDI